MPVYTSIEAWIKSDAIPFSTGSPTSIDSAVDRIAGVLGPSAVHLACATSRCRAMVLVVQVL